MSAPRVKVYPAGGLYRPSSLGRYPGGDEFAVQSTDAWFVCTGCGEWGMSHPESPDWTLAEAADAGRVHLARFHTALMPAGIPWDSHAAPRSACGCRSDKSPADVARGPQIAAQPFGDFAEAINRAHNESREDT